MIARVIVSSGPGSVVREVEIPEGYCWVCEDEVLKEVR